MILVIDNLDSFTYNLVDLLKQGPQEVVVLACDELTRETVELLQPDGILISPGPGRPEDAVATTKVVRSFLGKIPMMGVCLGHQMLGEMVGMKLLHAAAPTHGKTSKVLHDGSGVFEGMPNPFIAMRYHSLLLQEQAGQDPELVVTARTLDGDIMAIQHKILNFEAVQFHPESVLTEGGARLLGNWMHSLSRRKVSGDSTGR